VLFVPLHLIEKLGDRLALPCQRWRQTPEQPRQLDKSQFLQPQNAGIRRNIEHLDTDYRPGVDPFDHRMRGRAKLLALS